MRRLCEFADDHDISVVIEIMAAIRVMEMAGGVIQNDGSQAGGYAT